ncbi:MAG: glutamate-5-semialdehyde dehydrogenase [Planctomycetia bacterium]|nr:glutamate-5-semialdehyde dehydrogenase [Planctomycetia bacterium]MCC7315637.1 glutamate-5-semialdehyde dehydrogenase [Planctomycetota bacterium]
MERDIEKLAQRARSAAAALAGLSTATKNVCLTTMAGLIETNAAAIKEANALDLGAAREAGLGDAKIRRLTLTDAGIQQLAEGLRQVAALPDPVGQVTRDAAVPSGLRVRKVRCPIGVIMMIYEARPNVTIDAFALCFKSGNACILKGGREAANSNRILANLATQSLAKHDVSADSVTLLTTSDREEIKALLRLDQYIDLVIPRGGTELIRFVHEHSRIPMVQHFHGVCHIFVDESADLERAVNICATAKTSGPATCNAVEALLVHEKIAADFVPQLARRLAADGVELRGDETVQRLAPTAAAATDGDWGHEYLDLIVACRVVPDIAAAIEHIRRYGSNHTEAILSNNAAHQKRFVDEVHSSCVLVNASTRFNDGFQLGLGAEIGISTSKIHAYGPMGLEELTTQRYVVQGDWHSR